jgi:hypothetical protein
MSSLLIRPTEDKTISGGITQTYDTVTVEGTLTVEKTLTVVRDGPTRVPGRGTFPNTFPPTR